MDADELRRIEAALDAAVAQAKAHARVHRIDPEYREIVRHAREMHDLLLEALAKNERLATEYLRGLSDAAANAIDGLEALATLPDGKMQHRADEMQGRSAISAADPDFIRNRRAGEQRCCAETGAKRPKMYPQTTTAPTIDCGGRVTDGDAFVTGGRLVPLVLFARRRLALRERPSVIGELQH